MSFTHTLDIQLIKLALLILLFTILKSHVEYYLQATACMTKKYQYRVLETHRQIWSEVLHWAVDGWSCEVIIYIQDKTKNMYHWRTNDITGWKCNKSLIYTSKHNVECSYTLSILICYFNKTNYLKNPHFLKKKTINSNDFHETHDQYH